jgi:hypothetical protein
MSYSHRIFIYGPVGLLLLVVVGYSLFWKVSADMLSARLDRANGGEIMPGVVFAFADKTVGGFPFRLDVVLDGVTFAHEGPDGETAWRSEKLAIHGLTYGAQQYVLEAAGLQSIARPGENGAPPRVLYVTPGIARASVFLRDGEMTRFDLDLWQVQGKDASLGAAPDRIFSAARAQFHFLGNPDQTILVAAQIDGAKIGKGFAAPLGRDIEQAVLKGKITADAALARLRTGRDSFNTAAERWRAAKGALSVDSLYVKSDLAAGETLAGNVALTPAHQIEGTLASPANPAGVKLAFRDGKLVD